MKLRFFYLCSSLGSIGPYEIGGLAINRFLNLIIIYTLMKIETRAAPLIISWQRLVATSSMAKTNRGFLVLETSEKNTIKPIIKHTKSINIHIKIKVANTSTLNRDAKSSTTQDLLQVQIDLHY